MEDHIHILVKLFVLLRIANGCAYNILEPEDLTKLVVGPLFRIAYFDFASALASVPVTSFERSFEPPGDLL